MYKFAIKGYFLSCQSLLCRVVNSTVLKKKTTECILRPELCGTPLYHFTKATECCSVFTQAFNLQHQGRSYRPVKVLMKPIILHFISVTSCCFFLFWYLRFMTHPPALKTRTSEGVALCVLSATFILASEACCLQQRAVALFGVTGCLPLLPLCLRLSWDRKGWGTSSCLQGPWSPWHRPWKQF